MQKEMPKGERNISVRTVKEVEGGEGELSWGTGKQQSIAGKEEHGGAAGGLGWVRVPVGASQP